ncbi:MAG: hypothetical protein ACE5HW_03770 [Candidatus Methanofastidiosia archaeon]
MKTKEILLLVAALVVAILLINVVGFVLQALIPLALLAIVTYVVYLYLKKRF